jgi:hypothetical protein
MPWRSGSPQGVFRDEELAGVVPDAGKAWAEARVIGAEMIALPAATAMASPIIEPENFSRMMISFASNPKLVWTVAFSALAYGPDASFGPCAWEQCRHDSLGT